MFVITDLRKRTPLISNTYQRSPLRACDNLFLAATGFVVGIRLFRCRLVFIFRHFLKQTAATGAATRWLRGE